MNCRQIDKCIYNYCDDQVTPELRRDIEKHLQECLFCRNNVKLTRWENEILSQPVEIPALSPNFTAQVMASFGTQYRPTHSPASHPFFMKYSSIKSMHHYWSTAAVAIIMLLALFIPGQLDNINQRMAQYGNNSVVAHSQKSTVNREYVPVRGSSTSASVDKGQLCGQLQDSAALKDEDIRIEAKKTDATVSKQGTNNVIMKKSEGIPDQTLYYYDASMATADGSLKSGGGTSPSREKSKIANMVFIPLQPYNVPQPYKITRIGEEEGKNVFVYTDSINNKQFTLQLTPAKSEAEANIRSYQSPPEITFQLPAGTPDAPPSPPANSSLDMANSSYSINWNILSNNQAYDVTLEGNMSPEELASLANTITFK